MPHTPLRPPTARRALQGALAALLVGAASAQDLSADEVLENLEARTQALQDASFLLTGTIFDADGQEIILEVETDFIPDEELVRAYFIQPDALADNFVIVDGDTVYNYLFVTNQVTILNANDPDALGGLLPEVEDELEGASTSPPTWGAFSVATPGRRALRATKRARTAPSTGCALPTATRAPTSPTSRRPFWTASGCRRA